MRPSVYKFWNCYFPAELVADADIQSAAEAIFVPSPPAFQWSLPFSSWRTIQINGTTGISQLDTPQSHEPDMLQTDLQVFSIHNPNSTFDVEDHNCSVTLQPFPKTIRVPICAAFLDPLTQRHSTLACRHSFFHCHDLNEIFGDKTAADHQIWRQTTSQLWRSGSDVLALPKKMLPARYRSVWMLLVFIMLLMIFYLPRD